MSDAVKVPPKNVSINGKEDPSLLHDGFVPLVSLWDEPTETEAEKKAKFLLELKKKEEAVRQQGEEVVRAAQEEAGRIEEEAYQKGFAQGEAVGQAEGKKSFDVAVQRLEVLMSAVENQLAEKNNS